MIGKNAPAGDQGTPPVLPARRRTITSDADREAAVRRVTQGGEAVPTVAASLGVHHSTVRLWLRIAGWRQGWIRDPQ